MYLKTFISFILVSLMCLSGQIMAEANPQKLIMTATEQMMTELKANKEAIKSDPSIVNSIVERVLVPHIATNTIARKVLGKYARQATDEQQDRFAEAFKGYMIRFYSNAFAEYDDETVDYLDVPDYANERRVTIKTRLNLNGNTPIPIDYTVQRSGESWMIIDVIIEGISLVISNRTQFGSSISRDGLDTVIAKLEYKNTSGES